MDCAISLSLTKLLEQAIEQVRELPEADQDEAAEVLLILLSKFREPVRLDDQTMAAIREGSEQADRGEFVSDEEISMARNKQP